jgi:ABC-2 type transport system permease protein
VAGWEYARCFRWKHLLLAVFAFSAALLLKGRELKGGVVIVLTMMALAIAMLCMASGIRREKREQVAESLAAAVPFRAWLDGKLIGITGYGLSCMLLPAAAIPRAIPALLVWTMLALLLWNSFCAAIAAAFDRSRYLARRTMLLLPLLLAVPSAAVVARPAALPAKFLSLFPLTSAPAMPVRLLLSDVPPLEIIVSLALLAGCVWLMRSVAAGVFERFLFPAQ